MKLKNDYKDFYHFYVENMTYRKIAPIYFSFLSLLILNAILNIFYVCLLFISLDFAL